MTLSAREEQVLRLMTTQGLCTTKQLAHEMGLSPRTVEIYRGGLFHKMHSETLLN